MKTKILPIVISLLLFGGIVLAESPELPEPGLTPDSPFYFLETITEEISVFFTFGDLKKAERHAALAAERLAEARAVAEKGKSELAEKTLARYEKQLQNSIARAERARTKGENTEELMTKVGQATSKHLEVLAEVYAKIPEQAKPAIENAMEASLKGHERAVEALKAKNALGDVPEEVSLPENVPREVRERVQIRAQQELQIEKALEGVDMSKSLRDICAERGGTPEMCEQFPLEKFKSFKEIQDYCIELGGQSDICSMLEDKCREFGITTPNECFILLMVSSVSAYQSAEIKVAPVQPLPEEEMRQRDPDCPSGHVTYGQIKSCCEDSDSSSPYNEFHYYIKGTLECKVINTADGTLISHTIDTDSCDGNKLIERKYDNYHKASFEEYDCPNGCQDGACIGEITGGVMEERKNEDVSSHSGGIGVEIGIRNGQLFIAGLLKNSPAGRAGLLTGDKILAINSESAAGVTIDDAVKKISGEIGTKVVLKILRLTDGEEISLAISVTRASIAPIE